MQQHLQVDVPARRPLNVRMDPEDVIGPDDIHRLLVGSELELPRIGHWPARRRTSAQRARIVVGTHGIPLASDLVINRHGLELKAHNQHAGLFDLLHSSAFGIDVVIAYGYAQMVVDVEVRGISPKRLGERIAEAVGYEFLASLVAEDDKLGSGQVVKPHVGAKVGAGKVAKLAHCFGRPPFTTRHLTQSRDVGVQFVGGGFGAFPGQHLAQVLRQLALTTPRLTERYVVVVCVGRSLSIRRQHPPPALHSTYQTVAA